MGAGFNSHYDNPNVNVSIDFSKFKMVGIRDYKHISKLPYVPCVSCKSQLLEKKLPVSRDICIISHKDFILETFMPEKYKVEMLLNDESFEKIADYIASSKIIMTSSYHVAYWSILMGKKTIVFNKFSTKFDYFKYKPIFSCGDFEKDIEKTSTQDTFTNALQEARMINDEYFEKVKSFIENTITITDPKIKDLKDQEVAGRLFNSPWQM